jgi:hypothetical protein
MHGDTAQILGLFGHLSRSSESHWYAIKLPLSLLLTRPMILTTIGVRYVVGFQLLAGTNFLIFLVSEQGCGPRTVSQRQHLCAILIYHPLYANVKCRLYENSIHRLLAHSRMIDCPDVVANYNEPDL